MDRPQAVAKLRCFLEEELGLRTAALSDETPLVESGLIDSVGLVSLVAFCEEALGCQVPAEEITEEAFRSLASIAENVVGRWRRS